MAEILAKNISGKPVVGSDGSELGSLYNLTMNLETGRLEHLIIEPDEGYDGDDFDVDDAGRPLVPVNRVKAVKDNMIIER